MTRTKKHTELPSEWEELQISEVFEFKNTASFSRDTLSNVKTEKEVMYIHYGDIHATYKTELIDFKTETRIPYLKDEYINENLNYLQEGDLVLADASEDLVGIGESIEIKNIGDKKAIAGLHTFLLRDTNQKTVRGYRTYLLRNEKVHNSIKKIATGTSVYGISKGNLSKIKIPLPPLPEQHAIAKILSTWDTAIQTTQALISQKEQEKKWLMQNLLTGKKRLKGFSREWKDVKIGDVTTKFSRKNKDLIDCRVYSVTNYNGFVLQSDHFSREVAGDNLTGYKIIKKGEFAYNPARINVGSIAYFNDEIGIISSLYVCFSTNEEILDYFLEQIFKLDLVKHRIEAFGEGGVRVYLWYELFEKIKISIPTIEEQTAIAQILQSAENEIELLKTKLDQQKMQKKGLMQVLLTGKTRVRV